MRVVNTLGQVLVLTGAGGGGGTTFSAGVSTGGNTLGSTGTVSNQVVFVGTNGITLSQSTAAGGSATITISGITQSSQAAINALGVSDTGNTAGNTGTSSGITWVLAGSNANTLSQSTAGGGPNTVWIQGPVSATTISAVSAGNVIGTRGSRFALEDHQHAGVFSAGASNVGSTAGNTTVVPGRFVFAGSGGVTVSQETAAGSLNTLHVQGPVSATTISQVSTVNVIGTRGTRFALEDHQHLGVAAIAPGSNTGNTAGNTATQPGGTWVIAGSSPITISGSSGAAGIHTAWVQMSQTNQQITMFATSNTTQSSTGTTNASSLIFAGAGIASVGITNGSVLISVPAGGGAGDGGVFAGVSTGGNTAGSTGTVSTGNFVLVGSRGITLSQSTAAAGSHATVTILGPPPISSFANLPNINNSSVLTFGMTSLSQAAAFFLPEDGSFSFLRFPVTMSTNSTTLATLASATATAQGGLSHTFNGVVYSLGTGASSQSLISVGSGSISMQFSQRISITNSTQYSISLGISVGGVAGGGETNRTTQYSISNTNYSFTTNQIATEWSAGRFIDLPFATSLSGGPYWLVLGASSSTSSAGAVAGGITNCHVRYSGHYGVSQVNVGFGVMGSTNMTSGGLLGNGFFSTAGGGTTSAFSISAISSTASNPYLYFQLLRSA